MRFWTLGPGDTFGQEFIPSNGTIGFVDLWLYSYGTNTVTFSVSILEDSVNSGRQLGQASVIEAHDNPQLPLRFHFSPALSVTPGRTYVIRLTVIGSAWDWGVGSSSPVDSPGYLQGRMVRIPPLESYYDDHDLWFRVGPEAPSSVRSIYWQHENGTVARWRLNDVTFLNSRFLNDGKAVPPYWRFAAVSDFDGNGQDDFLWQHTNGNLGVTFMQGTNKAGSTVLNTTPMKPTNWKVMGMSDFDGDSKQDILWRNLNGTLTVWFMDGTNFLGSILLNTPDLAPGDGRVLGVGDFNRDSNTDILWQRSDGLLGVWFMDKTNFVDTAFLRRFRPNPTNGWRMTALADFDADNEPDLLWSHWDGRQTVWLMSETNRTMTIPLRQGRKGNPQWRIIGAR
ncbi:MAG: FG-GAP repeat domain-containing protein [Limisphaerales bacterium]